MLYHMRVTHWHMIVTETQTALSSHVNYNAFFCSGNVERVWVRIDVLPSFRLWENEQIDSGRDRYAYCIAQWNAVHHSQALILSLFNRRQRHINNSQCSCLDSSFTRFVSVYFVFVFCFIRSCYFRMKNKNNETAAAKHSIINHHYTYTNPFWMRFMPIDCRLESGASTRGSRNRLDLPPPSIQQRHNWSGSCDKFIHCSWLHKCITAVCVRCDCEWNNNISPLNINVYTVFSFYFHDTHLSMLKQLSNEFENSREI